MSEHHEIVAVMTSCDVIVAACRQIRASMDTLSAINKVAPDILPLSQMDAGARIQETVRDALMELAVMGVK